MAGERVRADTGQLEDPERVEAAHKPAGQVSAGGPERVGEPGRAEAEQALQAALTEAELRSSHRNYQCCRLLRN